MTHAETRSLGYAVAGSVAVHLLLVVCLAYWFGLAGFPHVRIPLPPPVVEEPEVTLVFPELAPPPPPQKDERYIRTTQNTEAAQPPSQADFVSDKNTVASSKAPPSPDGDKPLPTMKGTDYPTNELADRTFRDGDTKNDSAPPSPEASATMAPAAPAPPPAPKPPLTAPQMKIPDVLPVIAKKEDSPAETMMKELDAALANKKETDPKVEDKPPEDSKPGEKTDAPPMMRPPEEAAAPRAIPVAAPVVRTPPRPEKNAFQPETRRAATKGTLSNAGKEDAVNAAATPVGRYMRQVTGAIEKKWHQFRVARADAVEPGKMGLRFFVNKNGKVEDLEFIFKESNPLMEDFTIEAILKADIPPIPKDLLPILEKERVEITYDIVIHP